MAKKTKKAVNKGKAAIKKAANSKTGKEVIEKEKGILGDVLIRLGNIIKGNNKK